MPKIVHRTPKYRCHKASGQALVVIAGREHYLGPWKSKASRIEYDRLIGEWLAAGRPERLAAEADITVVELANQYWQFAKGYYVKDGRPTGAAENIKYALRHLKQYYGHTPAAKFGPLALKALQLRMVEAGQSRPYLNGNIDRIRRCFKWGVAHELVPASVSQALAAVPGLRKGKTDAREPEPIGPVSEEVVEVTLPHLQPIVADMVRLQRFTGARPAEICILRPCDVDRNGEVWAYRPWSHKTEHHGQDRVVFIGPKAQAILSPYLLRAGDAYCFSPKESEVKHNAQRREERKSPMTPSQAKRKLKRCRARAPGECYTVESYRRAIHRAAEKANVRAVKAAPGMHWVRMLVPRWSPNRLRHSAATEIRARYGLEAAATVLGHAKADVTQIYAERDLAKAASIMREVG